MIREATLEDVPTIVALGSRSLQDGPYRHRFPDNPEHTAKFVTLVIQALGKILLWQEDDGMVTGLLGILIFPHVFSGEITAQEIMWYVIPEFRAGGAAIKLLWEAEKLAKSKGAKIMQFTAPDATTSAVYQRFGYKAVEVSFEKAL